MYSIISRTDNTFYTTNKLNVNQLYEIIISCGKNITINKYSVLTHLCCRFTDKPILESKFTNNDRCFLIKLMFNLGFNFNFNTNIKLWDDYDRGILKYCTLLDIVYNNIHRYGGSCEIQYNPYKLIHLLYKCGATSLNKKIFLPKLYQLYLKNIVMNQFEINLISENIVYIINNSLFDINCQDILGYTFAHLLLKSITNNNSSYIIKMFKAVIDNNPDFSLKTKSGQTVLKIINSKRKKSKYKKTYSTIYEYIIEKKSKKLFLLIMCKNSNKNKLSQFFTKYRGLRKYIIKNINTYL